MYIGTNFGTIWNTMGRTRKDEPITTRNARKAFRVRKKPSCRSLGPGTAIGYQRKVRGGVWLAVEYLGGKNYRQTKLGFADDLLDADGVAVLDYEQAKKAAVAKFAQWRAADRASVDGPAPTVRSAIEAYVGMRDARERAQDRPRGDAKNRLAFHVLADHIADAACTS